MNTAENTMPMSEQERREYREDLGRIFTGIDDIRTNVVELRGEVSEKVSVRELNEALNNHMMNCAKMKESTEAIRLPALAPAPAPEPDISLVFTPLVKKLLVVAAVLGSFIGGLIASGGIQL